MLESKTRGEIVWYRQFGCPNQANSLPRFHGERHSSAGIMAKLHRDLLVCQCGSFTFKGYGKERSEKSQWTWTELDKTRIKP